MQSTHNSVHPRQVLGYCQSLLLLKGIVFQKYFCNTLGLWTRNRNVYIWQQLLLAFCFHLQRDTAGSSCSRKWDIWIERIIKINEHMNKPIAWGKKKKTTLKFSLPTSYEKRCKLPFSGWIEVRKHRSLDLIWIHSARETQCMRSKEETRGLIPWHFLVGTKLWRVLPASHTLQDHVVF